jgi:hypothetical protein
LIREADNLACQSWNEKMWSDGGPIDPSPTIDQAINGGFPWLEIECSRCKTKRDVDLCALRRPPTTCVMTSPADSARGARRLASARPRRCTNSSRAGDTWRNDADLTRRRYHERPDCWHVYYGDVHAGTIAIRVGNPTDSDPWEWSCGFYPGCRPGEHTNGTEPTFEEARTDFERAWAVLLANRTEADFQAMGGTGTLGNTRCGMPTCACQRSRPMDERCVFVALELT